MSTSLDQCLYCFDLVPPEDIHLWDVQFLRMIAEQIMVCSVPSIRSFCLKCKHCGTAKRRPSSARSLRSSVIDTFQRHILFKCKAAPRGVREPIAVQANQYYDWQKSSPHLVNQRMSQGFWTSLLDRISARRQLHSGSLALAAEAGVSDSAEPAAGVLALAAPDDSSHLPSDNLALAAEVGVPDSVAPPGGALVLAVPEESLEPTSDKRELAAPNLHVAMQETAMTPSFDQCQYGFALVFVEDIHQWDVQWTRMVAEQIMVCWVPSIRSYCLRCKHCGCASGSLPSTPPSLRESVIVTFQKHILRFCTAVPWRIKQNIALLKIAPSEKRHLPHGFWRSLLHLISTRRQLVEAALANSGFLHQHAHNNPAASIASEPAEPPADTLPLVAPAGFPMLPSGSLALAAETGVSDSAEPAAGVRALVAPDDSAILPSDNVTLAAELGVPASATPPGCSVALAALDESMEPPSDNRELAAGVGMTNGWASIGAPDKSADSTIAMNILVDEPPSLGKAPTDADQPSPDDLADLPTDNLTLAAELGVPDSAAPLGGAMALAAGAMALVAPDESMEPPSDNRELAAGMGMTDGWALIAAPDASAGSTVAMDILGDEPPSLGEAPTDADQPSPDNLTLAAELGVPDSAALPGGGPAFAVRDLSTDADGVAVLESAELPDGALADVLMAVTPNEGVSDSAEPPGSGLAFAALDLSTDAAGVGVSKVPAGTLVDAIIAVTPTESTEPAAEAGSRDESADSTTTMDILGDELPSLGKTQPNSNYPGGTAAEVQLLVAQVKELKEAQRKHEEAQRKHAEEVYHLRKEHADEMRRVRYELRVAMNQRKYDEAVHQSRMSQLPSELYCASDSTTVVSSSAQSLESSESYYSCVMDEVSSTQSLESSDSYCSCVMDEVSSEEAGHPVCDGYNNEVVV
jgi:hypothetical protein